MSDLARRVADNVRRLRESHAMSLAQLASRAGMSKSTLSQIESASTNPTLSTLESLAQALSVQAKDLISHEGADHGVVIVRAGDGTDVSGPSSVGRFAQSALVGPSVIEFHSLTLEPRGHESSASHGVGAREHVLVVEGTLRLGPDGDPITASAGDYVSYPADQVHRWQTVGDAPARYWIVATRPRGLAE